MKYQLASLVTTSLILAGCAQDGSSPLGGQKATLGTIIGGATGGLIGSQVGHGSGKGFAIAAGVIAGAAFGNYIGAKLDERDKEAASNAVNQALVAHNSHPVSWSNPESGNSGTTYAKPVYYEHGSGGGPAHAPATLQPPPAQLSPAAPIWVAPSVANLRAAPSTSAAIVGVLRANKNFAVLGEMPSGGWLVVGVNGKPVGYVSAKVVSPVNGAAPPSGQPAEPATPPATGDQTAPSTPPATPPATGQTPGMFENGQGLVDPNAVDRSVGSGSSEGGSAVACRTTVSTITLKGQPPQTTEAKFCQQSDGSWAPASS